jgi:hypothetical protein
MWLLYASAREETRTPTGVTPQASETCASTNFATRAKNKKIVPETGLEPAHLSAYAPQTYVSTNFTTRATIRTGLQNYNEILLFQK